MISKIKKILLAPPYVKHCSQTIYQALLGCIKMYECTSENMWRDRAEKVKDILIKIQRPDGGFDIGYDFNFGRLHKKGESTSPELVGLIALCEYERVLGYDKQVRLSMNAAAKWIEKFSIDLSNGRYAIPYGPYSIKEVMVYNGTSFACAALGCYIGQTKSQNENIISIYEGMNKYLLEVMTKDPNRKGKFWFYSDQEREDLIPLTKNKIDYYHQMQQVEVHSLAQEYYPVKEQKELIELAVEHVLDLQKEDGEVPYANDKTYFNNLVHVWGYSSVMSGFIASYKMFNNEKYLVAAKKVKQWLFDNSWNRSYFYASLDPVSKKVSNELFMVRSDAWVFNSLSNYYNLLPDTDLSSVLEMMFLKMEKCDFSGLENHSQNLRKKILIFLAKKIIK